MLKPACHNINITIYRKFYLIIYHSVMCGDLLADILSLPKDTSIRIYMI